MLVLSRHRDQRIMVGDDVIITVVDLRKDQVRLGIEAPICIEVHREEVYEAIRREGRHRLASSPPPIAVTTPTIHDPEWREAASPLVRLMQRRNLARLTIGCDGGMVAITGAGTRIGGRVDG